MSFFFERERGECAYFLPSRSLLFLLFLIFFLPVLFLVSSSSSSSSFLLPSFIHWLRPSPLSFLPSTTLPLSLKKNQRKKYDRVTNLSFFSFFFPIWVNLGANNTLNLFFFFTFYPTRIGFLKSKNRIKTARERFLFFSPVPPRLLKKKKIFFLSSLSLSFFPLSLDHFLKSMD